MESQRNLIRAYDVGLLLGYSTWTIKNWARNGRLPGAVFIGRHIRFDPAVIEQFIASGGQRPDLPKQPEFSVRHHGGREHAGNAPRNDCSRRDPARKLGELVKPDPGVRDFDGMTQPTDLARVPAAQYIRLER
jgi:predicted DNA-binding transcriptional regulator AlpA